MAIVPEGWVIKEESFHFCYWPHYESQKKLNKLIIDQSEIDFELSQKCKINIKYKSSKLRLPHKIWIEQIQ